MWSRSGPTVPVPPAADSVWQLPQPFAVKICLPWAVVFVAPPPPEGVVVVAGVP